MAAPMEGVLRRHASQNASAAGKIIKKEAASLQRTGAWKVDPKKLQPFIAPFAGFLSAFLEISTLFPMEYCKVQLQLNRKNPNFKLLPHLRSRGLAIYKGLPPMLVGAPLQGLLRFSSLDYFNYQFREFSPVFAGLAAGMAAGVLESVLVVTPMETIKTKLIDANKGMVEGVKYIIKQNGVSGLYNGVFPTILKSASNQGIRFIVFNKYKEMILESGQSKLTAPQSLFGGVLAGLIGCLLNTPFDVVKSRMQGLEGSRYSGVINCASTMIKEEGALSLYKGLLMRSGRVVPGQGIIFLSYEQISNALNTYVEN